MLRTLMVDTSCESEPQCNPVHWVLPKHITGDVECLGSNSVHGETEALIDPNNPERERRLDGASRIFICEFCNQAFKP